MDRRGNFSNRIHGERAVVDPGVPKTTKKVPSRQRSTRVPLADRVFDLLLVEFMSGIRPPGQRLNIEALSRELDISPTPVREALARLEHTGLIKREALRGYTVAPLLSRAEILQLMDARLLIEPTLAAKTALNATQNFLSELAETIEVMDSADEVEDGQALRNSWMADEMFHSMISAQAGNPFMDRAYQSLGGQLQRFRLLSESGSSHARRAAQDHKQIYEAIAAGDSDAAFQRMQHHIDNAKSRALDDQILVTRLENDNLLLAASKKAR